MIKLYFMKLKEKNISFLSKNLPENIKKKALLYRINRKKTQYIHSQWIRYFILSNMLECGFSDLVFEQNENGRPFLINSSNIDFNISHSNDYIILAISFDSKVGIDIEIISKKISILGIAEKYFSTQEYHWLSSLPKDKLTYWFYKIWTYKESCLKLTGEDMFVGLKKFIFSVDNYCKSGIQYKQEKSCNYRHFNFKENYIICVSSDNIFIKNINAYMISFSKTKNNQTIPIISNISKHFL